MYKNAVYIHMVWPTYKRLEFLNEEALQICLNALKLIAKEKNIRLLEVNGSVDHIHCLFALGPQDSLAKIAFWLKGRSSRILNQMYYEEGEFKWARNYYARSVSFSELSTVQEYIRNQALNHKL
ncbi:transposase [Saprospira grandis DSM 2844]|uniref:Transposase n=1 Tax=Saprospira grandis DSM 2844 TaxID=694433 RepID=J1I0S0_9BACT|nr:IS200/IS605 family transposase [Saprospira grandis]EJF51863.1 transposase [Saprospira grandis DSM 2844]